MGFSNLVRCWSFLWDTAPEIEGCGRMKKKICDLPDDLLVRILLLIPTKEAVSTTVLSKRWCYVWTMLPELVFKDKGNESLGLFIDKTLQLHKAPKLNRLIIKLGPGSSSVDVDVEKWVENAVDRCVFALDLKLLWTAVPTSFPKCLYTCDTLTFLNLSNKILVDVSSPISLPSLMYLYLSFVVYKDEDSLVRLLSSSPVLMCLSVLRYKNDNLKQFTVKVPSLNRLFYQEEEEELDDDDYDDRDHDNYDDHNDDDNDDDSDDDDDGDGDDNDDYEDDDLIRSLVIDSPGLKYLHLWNQWNEYSKIENVSCLDEAYIYDVYNSDEKFLKSLSSVTILKLYFFTKSMAVCCNAITFSRLIEFTFCPEYDLLNWLEPLMFFIQNSPRMKTLTISPVIETISPAWKQPSSIPGCLSSHLETFRWKEYRGREGEKQLLTYILANSMCLKTVEISLEETCNLGHLQKEIESMPRISKSARLIFPH